MLDVSEPILRKNCAFLQELVQGTVPFDYKTKYSEADVIACIRDDCVNSVLPFMVATRFNYDTLSAVFQSSEIVKIANMERTPAELLELFLFEKVARNRVIKWKFKSVMLSTEISSFVNDKIKELYAKHKSGNYEWSGINIFTQLSRLTSDYDRAELGGVSTPITLVEKVINSITNLNKRLSLLDPACGRGTFLVVLKEKLIAAGIPEEIVLRRITGIDIDPRKAFITSALLDPEGKYPSRIYAGDTLNKLKIGINMKFDIILGNPPYNRGIITRDHKVFNHPAMSDNKEGYIGFYIHAIEMLKDDGELKFITPGKFLMGPGVKDFRKWIVSEADLESVEFVDRRIFTDVSVDQIVIVTFKKREYSGQTKLINLQGNTTVIDIRKNPDNIIPSFTSDDIYKIWLKCWNLSSGIKIRWDNVGVYGDKGRSFFSEAETEKHHVKVICEIKSFNTPTYKWGLSSSASYNDWVVVTKRVGATHYALKAPGCDMNHTMMGLTVKGEHEAKTMLLWTQTKLYKLMFKAMYMNRDIHTFIRYIPVPVGIATSEDEIYTNFGLSASDIDIIRKA